MPLPLPKSSPIPSPGAAVKSDPGATLNQTGYASTTARFGGDVSPALTYDDELILQVQSPRGEIADTITAYGTRSGVYLPLGAITRFLDLAIAISDEGHYASGWFLDEKQTLSVNLRQGNITVGGQEISLAKGDAAALDGELYLRAERFSDILPLKLIVDLRAQTVTVSTQAPFPYEQRIAREQQRDLLAGRGSGRGKVTWPRDPSPYQALAFPLIDAEFRAVTDSTFGSRLENDLRLSGDLAFMTSRIFLSSTTRDGLTGARVELGRRDPDAGLLGPLSATEFQIGDVSTISMPIGLRATSGRGAFITNAPLERASVFETIELHGDLPQGYEVELYRNNILIGSTRDPIDGEYRFRNVSLDYGLNVFRLVFFGPQGQRREEVRQYSVGDGRLGTGEFVYSFGSAQKDVNLLNVYGPNFTPTLDRGAWRSSVLVQYGLSRQFTASLGASYFDSRFGQSWQVTSGLRTGLADTAIKLDFGYQRGGGKAAELGLGGRVLGVGYTLTHAEYRGEFTDEVRSLSGEYLRRATELNVNASLNVGGKDSGLVMPLYGQMRRFQFRDGRKLTDATLQASLPFSGYIASNTLNYSQSTNPGFASTTQLNGSFDLARLAGSRLRLRGAVDYAILPKLKLTGGGLEADYAIDERTSLRASVNHSLLDSRTNFGLSAIRRFDAFTLAFDGGYGVPTGDYRAALRLGFSFGRNPLNGRVFFAEPGMASGGAVAARAFRDSNGNKLFDSGEQVLPDVEFNTSSRFGKTDAQGVVLIGGLGDGRRASLVLDRASLPDLDMAPASDGIEVVTRAGRIHTTDFAIQELSAIDGTAYFSKGESLGNEVSGLRLLLVDGQGKTISKARTGGDGSFFFEQIAPGRYAIQIEPNQASSLKIRLAEDIAVTIGPKSDFLKQTVKIVSEVTPDQ